jgi:dihydroorotate dehydrogenase
MNTRIRVLRDIRIYTYKVDFYCTNTYSCVDDMYTFFIGPPFGNYIDFLPGILPIKGSYTLEPRSGLFSQICKTLRYDFERKGWINKIGLRNPGLDYAVRKYIKGEHVVSIAILQPSDIDVIVRKIPVNMDIELNVSCPNAEKPMETHGLSRFLNSERKWCIVKLSPTCDTRLIDQYYLEGFRQFHCSNTVPVPPKGGLSGKSIMQYNEQLISYIREKYPDTEVIGGGGISRWSDIELYKTWGAQHFAFSTVSFCPYLFGKLYWNILQITKN